MRVWHSFWTWEDVGMWREVSASEYERMLPLAVTFTGNAVEYGAAMMKVLEQFPIACEHNLTEPSMNRQAWIGHAAAYLEHELPEWITREAWGALTQQQRDEANAMADRAINEWQSRYAAKNRKLHPQMDLTGIP